MTGSKAGVEELGKFGNQTVQGNMQAQVNETVTSPDA